jgi:hypothetical protein
MQRLTVLYAPEDEWHGELVTSVQSGVFAGGSAAWFGIDQLRAFSEELGAFPIAPQGGPTLNGGFWSNDTESAETHVSIRIEPEGPRGRLRVDVLLATPSWNPARSDQHSVRARFLVNYADLGAFQRDFAAMLNGKALEACLEATST